MSWRGPMYRDPRAVVLFGVMALGSVGTALGAVPLPGSLQSTPGVFGQTAAATLCFGSAAATVGILMRDRMDGLVVEQFGHIVAGVGAFLYAFALFANVPPPGRQLHLFGFPLLISSDALIAFAMSISITAACAVQWWRIFRFRRRLKAEAKTIADLLEP